MSETQDNTTPGRHLLTPGRSEQLRALYETCSPRVLGYALRRTTQEEAEEVVAETFVVAWRRLDEIPKDPIPWLLGVARRVLANQRRSSGRRQALDQRVALARPAISTATSDPAEEVVARMTLDAALAQLTEWDREALLLVVWDGLDNRKAARVMNCSTTTFTLRLHRARRRLTERFHSIERSERKPRVARVQVEESK